MEGVFLMSNKNVVDKVRDTLVKAGSVFKEDKKEAYKRAIEKEDCTRAKWILQTILDNAVVAEKNNSPLCDDTGIPHLVLEVGPNSNITGKMLSEIRQGIMEGLVNLPGRPMGIIGGDEQRIDQSGGISENSEDVLQAPILLKEVNEDITRLNILMLGGGPAIRGKTYRVFHKHSKDVVLNEIVKWATESVEQLGCSPCTLAVGIGRSQFEASSMMMEALVEGNYNIQSDMESYITEKVNESNIGPMGLRGKTSVLATFMKVGPQRSSGVRIVCLRPCCCFEPRIARVEL